MAENIIKSIATSKGSAKYDYESLVNKPNIPTKTSDLTNDSNYITSEALNNVAPKEHEHSYAPLFGGASIVGWYTFEDGGVNAQFVQVSGEDVATKSEIPTKTSDLSNDSGFLTEHQDLSEYIKKQDTIIYYEFRAGGLSEIFYNAFIYIVNKFRNQEIDSSNYILVNATHLVKINPTKPNYYILEVVDLINNIEYKYRGSEEDGYAGYDYTTATVEDFDIENAEIISYQRKLTAGTGITISEDNVISASGEETIKNITIDNKSPDNIMYELLTKLKNNEIKSNEYYLINGYMLGFIGNTYSTNYYVYLYELINNVNYKLNGYINIANDFTLENITYTTERYQRELTPGTGITIENNVISSESVSLAVEITYAELKTLRDNSNLVVGQQYRITDYVTTTTQTDTQSANHQFDIIVTADSSNSLNENAKATKHEGDNYFEGSDLESWELKYSFDNDKSRFDWADEVTGKGVIYYMKDEHDNEVPYDFKNIQFKRYKISSFTDNFKGNATLQTLLKDSYVGNYDNDNNTVPENTVLEDFKWFYTFTQSSSLDDTDSSLTTTCYCNVIKPCYTNTTTSSAQIQILNDNVLIRSESSSESIHSNVFEDNCFSNTLSSDNRMNHFSNYCRYNLLTDRVRYASFGYNNSYNVIGKNSYSTKFGNYCHRNVFGENCYANTFSNNCNDNIFYDKCYSNIFGNECGSNTLKNECHSNIFGNNCYSNSLHNYCNSNVFKNNCYNNDFGQWCNNITFDDKCYNIIIPNSAVYVDFKNACHHISCPDHIRNVSFDNGIAYLTVESSSTDSLYVQNMEFKSGISGTSDNIKSIYVVRNRSYKTRVEKDKDGKILVWYQKDENTKEGYYYPSISSDERIEFSVSSKAKLVATETLTQHNALDECYNAIYNMESNKFYLIQLIDPEGECNAHFTGMQCDNKFISGYSRGFMITKPLCLYTIYAAGVLQLLDINNEPDMSYIGWTCKVYELPFTL